MVGDLFGHVARRGRSGLGEGSAFVCALLEPDSQFSKSQEAREEGPQTASVKDIPQISVDSTGGDEGLADGFDRRERSLGLIVQEAHGHESEQTRIEIRGPEPLCKVSLVSALSSDKFANRLRRRCRRVGKW